MTLPEEFRRLIGEISTRLVTAPPDDLDGAIRSGLASLGSSYSVDRAALAWLDEGRALARRTHHWERLGEPLPSVLTPQDLDGSWPRLLAGDVVRKGSVLLLPLAPRDSVDGLLMVGTPEKRSWAEHALLQLQRLGQVLINSSVREVSAARLKESEARYRSVVEDQTEFIVRWLPGGIRTWVNDSYCHFFGSTRAELVGTSFFPLIDQADRARIEAELAGLTPEHPSRTGEHRVLLPDGSRAWQEWTDRALFDDAGSIVEIQSVGRDITERKETEAALRESEARYRSLVESTADWIWQIDLEGRHVYSNDRLRDVLGYSESELPELPLEALIHPDDLEDVQLRLPGLIAEKKGWSGWIVRFRHKDGRYRHLHSSARPVLDEAGEVCGFRGIDRDVTFTVLLSLVSSRLLQADPETVDARIQAALADIGASYALDRASLWWAKTKDETTSRSHEWARPGMEGPRSSFEPDREIPWASELVFGGKTLRIESLADVPAEAARDRAFFEEQGIRSTLAIPLTLESRLVGVAVFSTVARTRTWPEDTEQELRLFGETLANAYERARNFRSLLARERELRAALSEIGELRDQLEAENVQLREEVRTAHGFDRIVGNTPSLRRCLSLVRRVAPTDATVLITGETGTGKELIARSIHELSPRKDKPLVNINCAALPAELIESELFGHEKGAFTGAASTRQGRFELANLGSLFLDEIGDLPLALQAKLLRVIQEGEFERLGGTTTERVDVRLIAATNRDLGAAVREGRFREDLYYRVCTFPVQMPSLAERREDIPLLVAHFVSKHAARLGRTIERVSPWMLDTLQERSWPGNIRELENVIVRSLISTSGPVLTLPVEDPPAPRLPVPEEPATRTVALADVERDHIIGVLRDKDWVLGGPNGAAAELGMKRTTLQSKMKKLGIRRPSEPYR